MSVISFIFVSIVTMFVCIIMATSYTAIRPNFFMVQGQESILSGPSSLVSYLVNSGLVCQPPTTQFRRIKPSTVTNRPLRDCIGCSERRLMDVHFTIGTSAKELLHFREKCRCAAPRTEESDKLAQ
jgi:hypothetical protein